MSLDRKIRIGTRASELALRQAGIVQRELLQLGLEVEVVKFRTTGDKNLDTPLAEIGAKGLFTEELERALRARKVDLCVHSLKDLPTESPPEIQVAAMLEREDPRDVLVVNDMVDAESIAALPSGTRVGTSSLRRRAQLRATRRDVDLAELRGNVPTRIKKVDDGIVHAAILAAAGLHRLGIHQRIRCYLEPPEWLPAAGQGVIAVQTRADDAELADVLGSLHHIASAVQATAERAFLQALEGGCQVPIGALVVDGDSGLVLHGMVAEISGRVVVRGSRAVDRMSPELAGRELAAELLEQGGARILSALRREKNIPPPQPE